MASVALKSAKGSDVGSLELDGAMFGIQPNVPVMHQVVTAQLAHRRAGTQSTKTRAEVSGGGKKPLKQRAPVAHVRVQPVPHTSVEVALHSVQSLVSTARRHQRK